MARKSVENISVLGISADTLTLEYLSAQFSVDGDNLVPCKTTEDAETVLCSQQIDAVVAVNSQLPTALAPLVVGIEFTQEVHRAILTGPVERIRVERLPDVTDITHHMVNRMRRIQQ